MRIKGLWTVALTVWLVPVMSAVLSGGLAAQTPGPRMPLGGLEKLAAAASETVDVSLDAGLLALAARFIDDGERTLRRDVRGQREPKCVEQSLRLEAAKGARRSFSWLRLRERRGTGGVECDVPFDFPHRLMDVPVKNGEGTEAPESS